MKFKKLLCLALALVCAFCFAVPVFAESGSEILIDQYQDQLADGGADVGKPLAAEAGGEGDKDDSRGGHGIPEVDHRSRPGREHHKP